MQIINIHIRVLKLSFINILFILINLSVSAQSTSIVISNSKEMPGKIINIKWLSSGIIYEQGVNIYRRQDNVPFWQKINNAPIIKANYTVPPYAYEQDSTLVGYVQVASEMKPEDFDGLAKVFTLLKSVYSNQFALYLGIQYNDSTVQEGVKYQYMVKKIKGEKQLFEAVSEHITAGAYLADSAPKNVRVEGLNKKVNIWWEVENKRFHSINIYRYSNFDTIPLKLNPVPIVLAERPGADGKVSYPDVYFIDKKVNNDTNYFYSLAGIDFFGRETMYSNYIMASPRNKTPPPAPEMIAPKITLLNVDVSWIPNKMKKVIGYHVYRTPSIYSPFERITTEMLSTLAVRYSDKVIKPGNYYYYVAAIDKNGNEGKSNMVMAEVLDIYPPPIPKNLTAVADSGEIALSWNSVKDEHLGGYRIYRTVDADNRSFYVLINAKPVVDTFFIDKLPFNARNRFFYSVVAIDTAFNMSDFSVPVSAVMPDITPPDIPFLKNITNKHKALFIEWLPNRDADLMGYYVYRKEFIDSMPQIIRINKSIIPKGRNNFIDIDIKNNVKYLYYVKAIDSVGNLSGESNHFPAMLIPEKEIVEVGLKNISVKYNPVKDDVEISWQYFNKDATKGVVIFRKDDEEKSLRPVSGLITDKKYKERIPKSNTNYYYIIIAYAHTGEKWTSGEYLMVKND